MTINTVAFIFFFGWACSTSLFAQNLELKVISEDPAEAEILNTLEYNRFYNDYMSLEHTARDLEERLQKLGYLECNYLELQKSNDSLYRAFYSLGPIYKKARITFPSTLDQKILNLISATIKDNYFEVAVEDLENTLKKLNSEIANYGDPFASLRLANIQHNNGLLLADLKIIQHTRRNIDSIVIKGYEKFPKSFVKRYLKLQPGQPFNLKNVTEKTEALENLPFASQLKTPEVLFTRDSTLLYLYLEKQKSNTFDGFLGFGTDDTSGKLEFDGYLNLNLINNLNYGESLKLLYKSDENEQKTFEVKAKLPYLFKSPIGLQTGLSIFKKDSTFVTTSQFVEVDVQINPQHSIGIGLDAQASTNLLDIPIASIDDFKTIFYNLHYTHIKRERFDKLFPINFFFDATGGFGKRRIEKNVQPQTKFTLNTYKSFNLNLRNSIYTQLNLAVLNSERFIANELFRFGGINSIRGFEENSLTANLFTVLNTEYRYRLSNSLYVNSIIDLAYFENQILDQKSKLLGLGFGFGVLTQAGLLKLNYSNGSFENQPIRFSNSKIHISLSATF